MSSALDLGKWGLAPARPSGTERKGNGLADTILKEIHSSVLDLKKERGWGRGVEEIKPKPRCLALLCQ